MTDFIHNFFFGIGISLLVLALRVGMVGLTVKNTAGVADSVAKDAIRNGYLVILVGFLLTVAGACVAASHHLREGSIMMGAGGGGASVLLGCTSMLQGIFQRKHIPVWNVWIYTAVIVLVGFVFIGIYLNKVY